MKLRIPVGFIVVVAVLLLVIAFSSCSDCQKFVPYAENNLWSSTSSYQEGMTSLKPIQYSTYPNNASVDVLDALHVNNATTAQGSGAVQSPGVRLWGFGSNLYSGTDNDNKPIDIFGPTPGSPQCVNRSFGLSKSTGPLCITDEQFNLLTTRGIGASAH